jgi:hypothetical protein
MDSEWGISRIGGLFGALLAGIGNFRVSEELNRTLRNSTIKVSIFS